ncbi:class I SAM-dependent methyltransferase [Candidatus Woesearchaeota archaeon]|nr:class I SAM-dependent methyltransferase [Candidatus Woesearchaeota archaeon]
MSIKNLQRNWEGFARKDPLWAICSEPGKMQNRWNKEEFFLTGRKEIDAVMSNLAALKLRVGKGAALDFGCGVGRLTQALSGYFRSCCGVDISPTMVKLANEFNKYPKKCSYRLNASGELSIFEDSCFSFIYSSIVFQHMHPSLTAGYLKEFLRIASPGAVMVFQVPERKKGSSFTLHPRTLAGKFLAAVGFGLRMEMHYVSEEKVRKMLEPAEIVDVKLIDAANFRFLEKEPGAGYVIKQYYARVS